MTDVRLITSNLIDTISELTRSADTIHVEPSEKQGDFFLLDGGDFVRIGCMFILRGRV